MIARIGSLFSGIGGLELGLEMAGLGPVAWQAESDPFARQVLARHWPDARRFADVRDVTEASAERVEVVCGGFPCTDISLAGRGAGIDGPESGLWREFARVVGELRPRAVVIENVVALVHRGLGRVLSDLAACGYDALWFPLRAADVGAPHRRERIFVVAWRVPDADGERLRIEPERDQRSRRGERAADGGDAVAVDVGANVADADVRGREAQRLTHKRDERRARGDVAHGHDVPRDWPPGPSDADGWQRWLDAGNPAAAESTIRRAPDGLSGRLAADWLRCLGNAVVPQVAEVVGLVAAHVLAHEAAQ